MIPCSETFLRTSMTPEQAERIATALACPDEDRDIRALVIEDNMMEYGWISNFYKLTKLSPKLNFSKTNLIHISYMIHKLCLNSEIPQKLLILKFCFLA